MKIKSLFDRYVGIDWSGAKSPLKSYSVALASCNATDDGSPNAITSKLSRTDVYEYILGLADSKQRGLVGIDCNFGYAQSVAQTHFGDDINYRKLWSLVDNINDANPNFFAGKFWQHPKFQSCFWTKGKQPEWFKLEALRRLTEQRAIDAGLGIPESPFKLIGAKQVGKGGLAGMRLVHQLKQQLGDKLAIWPFEQSNTDKAQIVVCEIYPRLFIKYANYGNLKVRDLDTLNDVLNHLQSSSYFSNIPLNDHLSDAIIASAGLRYFCEHRQALSKPIPDAASLIEGWIFGVPF